MKHEILLYINTLLLFVILVAVIVYFYSSKNNYEVIDGTNKSTLKLGNRDLNKVIHLNNFGGGVVKFELGTQIGVIELISNDSGIVQIDFTGTFKIIEVGNNVSPAVDYRLAPAADNTQTYMNFADQAQEVSGRFKNFAFKFFCDQTGIFCVGTVEDLVSLS